MPTPVISIRNLSFTFNGAEKPALRNLSLDIFPGEFVILAGESGCGKSTLAKAMSGHIPHVIEGETSGSLSIDGIETRNLDLSDIAVRVSLCQQDPESQFCTLTARDEVGFGPENLALPKTEVARRVDASLEAVNGLHLKERDIFHLSGGEQQRVAIASMLAMKPEVLILDEPTSSLGPDSALEVWAAVENLRAASNTTIIVIEHKFDRLLPLADRMIVMNRGEIALDGEIDSVYERYKQIVRPDWPAPSPRSETETRKSIRVSDLKFSYEDKEILHGISLDANAGEFIGIIGANGSGKTTFLSCLAGLERPTSGSVEVEGIDTRKASVSGTARKIGFVFQSPNHQLFEGTVFDEVTFASRNFGLDRDVEARKLIGEYGLAFYSRIHPLKLSHGEKRRLNLCSVLPHDPPIILLDEPFIGQDAANTARILDDLMSLRAAGRTIVMVSHDMEIVFNYCDRVVLFDAGRILVDGTPERAMEAIAALEKPSFLPGLRPV
jgi:energy-coupling factor transport system ATP-binding protein